MPPREKKTVTLALRVLLPHVQAHQLNSFWIVADDPNRLQRRMHLRDMVREFAERTGCRDAVEWD